MHTPEPTPNPDDPRQPDTPQPPVPPDMEPVVPVEEPPKPGRTPGGEPPPMIVRGMRR